MKKRKETAGPVTRRQVRRVLAAATAQAEPPRVKVITGERIKLTMTEEESGFLFVANLLDDYATLCLDMTGAVAHWLPMFRRLAAERGIPVEFRQEFAEDRAATSAAEFVKRLPQALDDALLLLSLESTLAAARVERAVEEGDELRPPSAAAVNRLAEFAAAQLRKRIPPKGPGGEPSVSFSTVAAAIVAHGGENARAQDVATAVGLSPRQLFNLRKGWNPDAENWRDFTGYVMRLFIDEDRE